MRYSAIAISGKARGLFAACLLGGASLPATVGPGGAEPAIRVEGNQRIEEASIRTYFHAANGQPLEAADLDAGLKALYATGLFADVRIQRSGDQVIVVVVENPTLGRVGLEGNRKIKEAQLKIDIRSKSGGPLWRPLVQQDVARMVDIYRRGGYFEARVEPKIIAGSDQQSDLVFEISEGGKTGVKKILFVGNHAYSSDRLKGAIQTGETNLLSFLLSNDVYDPDRIESDRDLLRRFYLKHGYADIRIVAARPQYDPEQKGIVLTFTVEEGSQYRIGTVGLRSNLRDSIRRSCGRGCGPLPATSTTPRQCKRRSRTCRSKPPGMTFRSSPCSRGKIAIRPAISSIWSMRSSRVPAAMWSASTSAAIARRRTSSSGANSTCPKATPPPARGSRAPSGG